jgi:1,4-alpha-glucan branching enzyme
MGCEIGQWREWNYEASVDWQALVAPTHRGIQRFVRDLNTIYRGEPALHQNDCVPSGFEWVDCSDYDQGVISFMREGKIANDFLLIVFNFTPVPREKYHLGAPWGGNWREVLNSDAEIYGGSNLGNAGVVHAAPIEWHGRSHLLNVTLPPLGMLVFKPV